MKTSRKLLSILFSLVMAVSLLEITLPTSVGAAEYGWHPIGVEDIQDGDTVIITMMTGMGYYGLPNENVSSGAPAAIPFDYMDNTVNTQEKLIISDEDVGKFSWIVGFDDSYLTFSTPSEDMLWCFGENNGVRVGINDKTRFSIESGYLFNDATSRYLGVYNSQDWRCYLNTGGNISAQFVQFWTYTEDDGTYETSGDDPSGDEPDPGTSPWHEVQLDEINDGDEVIFTSTKDLSTYGLKNSRTPRVPLAVGFTINNDCLLGTDEDLASCTWIIGRGGDSLSFSNASGEMLFCSDKNDGVGVGSGNSNTDFTVVDGYLYDDNYGRYLGVYNGQDWRCYTTIASGSNIKGQTLQFWKCEEPEPISDFPAFMTGSVTLGAQLGLNFYIDMPEKEGISYDESFVDFSIKGKEIGRKFVNEDNRNEKGYYRFTADLNVAQMAETVTAVFYYEENGEEQTLENKYSIKDYITAFESVRDEEPYSKAAELVDAIADYGHYTQVYLADANNWTYGEDYAAMDFFHSNPYSQEQISEAVSGLAEYGFKNVAKSTDIESYGMSLLLDSKTAFNLFVKPADGYTGTVSATVEGKDVNIKKLKDGRYKVTVPNISAHQLGGALNFVITTDHGEAKFTTYPLYYVRTALGDGTTVDEIKRDAMTSVYRYSKAANNYKASGGQG